MQSVKLTTQDFDIIDEHLKSMKKAEDILQGAKGTYMESSAKWLLIESIKDVNNALEGKVTERTRHELTQIDWLTRVIKNNLYILNNV